MVFEQRNGFKTYRPMTNSADLDQTALWSSLIWVCTVCSSYSTRKLRKIIDRKFIKVSQYFPALQKNLLCSCEVILLIPNPAVDWVIPGNPLAGDPGVGFCGTRDARLPGARLPGNPVLVPTPGTPQDLGIPRVSAWSI